MPMTMLKVEAETVKLFNLLGLTEEEMNFLFRGLTYYAMHLEEETEETTANATMAENIYDLRDALRIDD